MSDRIDANGPVTAGPTISDQIEFAHRRYMAIYQEYDAVYNRMKRLTRELHAFSNSLVCREYKRHEKRLQAMWEAREAADAEISRLAPELDAAHALLKAMKAIKSER